MRFARREGVRIMIPTESEISYEAFWWEIKGFAPGRVNINGNWFHYASEVPGIETEILGQFDSAQLAAPLEQKEWQKAKTVRQGAIEIYQLADKMAGKTPRDYSDYLVVPKSGVEQLEEMHRIMFPQGPSLREMLKGLQ